MRFTSARSKEFYRPASLLVVIALASVLFLATIAVAAQPSAPDSATAYLQGPDGLVHVGDEITVTVGISDVVDLYGVQMTLDFITASLQVVDADGGTAGLQIKPGECPVPDFVASNSADNTAGTIGYATTQVSPTLPFSGDCNMAYIRFQTLQVMTTVVQFSDLILADPDHGSIPNTTLDLILDIVPPLPVADFSGTPTSGIAPTNVDFTNLSTGVYDTCAWDFGDGSTSTICASPSNEYAASGVYTVSLTIDGPGGSSNETKVDYVTIFEPVNADFGGAPTAGIAPLTVDFTNLSTGDFDSCSWDFGDGSTSFSCAGPSNEYTAGGVYSVSLTASGFGGTNVETKIDYISVYEPVSAAFSGSPTSGIAPLQVDFSNSSSGDYDTCSWDFGDGGSSDDCDDPTYSYLSSGVYTVSLAVSGLGGTDTETAASYITVYEPVSADFSGTPTGGIAPLLVDFVDLSSGDYDTCSWEFGDSGTSSNCTGVSNNYAGSGVYTVSLTVSGLGGSNTETKVDYISVFEPTAAEFSGSPTSGIAPLLVDFVDVSSGDYDTCAWDFGDGNTSTSCTDPSNNYTSSGVYTVSLTVSGLGGSDTEIKTEYITVYEPTLADFRATPTTGVAPLSVELLNLSTGDFDSCDWEFGDGGTSNDCNDPSHVYTLSGVYTVTLTVSGDGGTDSETKMSYITVVDEYYTYIPVIIKPS